MAVDTLEQVGGLPMIGMGGKGFFQKGAGVDQVTGGIGAQRTAIMGGCIGFEERLAKGGIQLG